VDDYQLIVSLIDGTNDLVYSVLPNRSFEFVNNAWLKQLGYTEQDLTNLKLKDTLFPGSLRKHDELVSEVLAGASKSGAEFTLLTKNGTRLDVEGNMFPRMEDKNIVAATGFFRNVTEQKRAQNEIEDARSKIEFITDLMIHDLTNINQEILSMFEIFLYDPSLERHHKSLVQEGINEVEKASKLIANVRKVAGFDEVAPEQIDWDVWKVFKHAQEEVALKFPEKILHLKTNIHENEYFLRADRFLPDVFFSLLHNSTKFDRSDEVVIEINAEPIKHTPFLRIEVKDFGPGIPDAEKADIFIKAQRRESILGTGIGLSLVKALVKNYGGYINIEDRVEGDYTKGVNFILMLRRAKSVDL